MPAHPKAMSKLLHHVGIVSAGVTVRLRLHQRRQRCLPLHCRRDRARGPGFARLQLPMQTICILAHQVCGCGCGCGCFHVCRPVCSSYQLLRSFVYIRCKGPQRIRILCRESHEYQLLAPLSSNYNSMVLLVHLVLYGGVSFKRNNDVTETK